MGACLSCTTRTEDELFPSERTGLLSDYGSAIAAQPGGIPDPSEPSRLEESQREEYLARIVAATEESLIDIFTVGAHDRRVPRQRTIDYKALLGSIPIPDSSDKVPLLLPSSSIEDKEVLLLQELGRASSSYVDDLYHAKSVGPLVVDIED
ncbi:uncharacterized protein V1510DRAFT_414355 [Dipodascopsis tothii]|uniref:uncharacterized protein n=1 Tax=Dipodascopsis tothii TaxID=44089 RepID=UPI0034CE6256